MDSRKNSSTFVAKWLLVGIAWCFAVAGVGNVVYAVRGTFPVDFQQFYFAGKLAGSGRISQLYHKAAYEPLVAELRASGIPISPIYYFNRPAFAAFLYVPFGWLPYRTAALLAMLVNLALLGVLVWKLPIWFPFPEFMGVALFRACLLVFTPFVAAIGQGQDALLLTSLAAYSIYLASRNPGKAASSSLKEGRDSRSGRGEVWAGVLLAGCVIKPHLIWAMPLAVLAQRRWRMLYSFLATGILAAALCFGAVGPRGAREWFELLQAPSTDFVPEGMGNVRALGLHFGAAAAVVAALLVLFCFAMVLRRGSPADQFSAAILTSLLLGPHTYRYDLSLLAVVALLAARPAPRYLLLVPWLVFYPRLDVLPIVFLALGYLAALAAGALRKRRRQHDTPLISPAGAEGASSVRSSICG